MTDTTSRLRLFRDRLENLMGGRDDLRPFVCDGSPYECTAFVVGINPASRGSFWPFWNDDAGFDRSAWLCAYKAQRGAEPLMPGRIRRQSLSSTRQRIDWIVAAAESVKILETNLYGLPTPAASDLGPEHRDATVFEFLLSEIKPHVLLLHGKEVRPHFERRFGCHRTGEFPKVEINGRAVRVAFPATLASRWMPGLFPERVG